MTKKCTVCKKRKPLGAFNAKKTTRDGFQTKCRDCSRVLARSRYQRNKKSEIERIGLRKIEIRERLAEYKKGLKCLKCPECEPCCLDFHHSDEKEFTIATAVVKGYSWDRIREEIEKCVVLCSNCHRKVHHGVLEV